MNLGIIIPGIFQDCKNKFILLHLNLHICKMEITILYSFSPCCDKISEVIRNGGFILAYGWRDVVHHDRTTWLQELEAPGHTVLALNASAQFAFCAFGDWLPPHGRMLPTFTVVFPSQPNLSNSS